MTEGNGGGSWIRSLCCRILRSGHIPKHVAIIMDGNRRFARKMQYNRTFQGHVLGFDKFMETLEWCLDLGITELTVYAFSIENFKRPKDEVDGLMEMAKQKVTKLLDERDELDRSTLDLISRQKRQIDVSVTETNSVQIVRDVIMKHGVCIRVLGDLELLPRDVLESVARAVNFSRNNNQAFLNVCFSYTSRHEMTEAIRRLATGAQEEMILPSDISEELFQRCLYSGDSPPPDLVIRTSGEVRLSDFLLWQTSYSCLCFQDVLWPEFSIWNFFSAILSYQMNYQAIQTARERHRKHLKQLQYESDQQCVMATLQHNGVAESTDLEQDIVAYAKLREERIKKFLEHIKTRHREYLEQACPCT